MSDAFWLRKIWGSIYNLSVDELRSYTGLEAQQFWDALQDLAEKASDTLPSLADQIDKASSITDASDRAVINTIQSKTDSPLTVSHLLSGANLTLSCNQLSRSRGVGGDGEVGRWGGGEMGRWGVGSGGVIQPSSLPEQWTTEKYQQLFWWLWRCLPQAVSQQDESFMLTPASMNLPDASLWSHNSMTAALAGAMAGYDRSTNQDAESEKTFNSSFSSHPYLAIFTFTPIQELIKASRKMRDFWAGSWILHYLSAKICWQLAQKYGPDSFVYPSLYQQPLIDHWLLQKWGTFQPWVEQPSDRALLTAGFPNVIVLVLPQGEVKAAMQTARQTLLQEWLKLGNLVFQELQSRQWTKHLKKEIEQESRTWNGWLKVQWQPYWTALPLGKEGEDLTNTEILGYREQHENPWLTKQNQAWNLEDAETKLFHEDEFAFLQAVKEWQSPSAETSVSVNVGSWWPYVFDQVRFALSGVKNARSWEIPTAFGPRSTISGIGPVVYPDPNEFIGKGSKQHSPITEKDTKDFWKKDAGLFDGTEQLNATETVKRTLHQILPKVFDISRKNLSNFYPDLSSGVAGWLRQMERIKNQQAIDYFETACADISTTFPWTKEGEEAPAYLPWGIPWIATHHSRWPNPRLLNAGWLIDDFPTASEEQKAKKEEQKAKKDELSRLLEYIAQKFSPGNNPTDWYVLAVGDGDGMNQWLKGIPLKQYRNYMPSGPNISEPTTEAVREAFDRLIQLQKRMGPSTHNALSRALLDFSNQLLPYLTEERYAGRLIYGGGDDVLAYTNLWEWDSWLWDVRQCFRGAKDPLHEFEHQGDYWKWIGEQPPDNVSSRPLFTMGSEATISFGIVVAHHSVPLAIALENLWAAEKAEKDGAKEHKYHSGCILKTRKDCYTKKDAVQVRIIYSNGNILKSTAKFEAFSQWRELLNTPVEPQYLPSLPALFEQAAQIWSQHPAPVAEAIAPWTKAFCSRRQIFSGNESTQQEFQQRLTNFIYTLSSMTKESDRDREVQNWLKLAAFIMRNRDITIKL